MVHSFLRLTGETARFMCQVDCDKAFFCNSLNYSKNICLRDGQATVRFTRAASGEYLDWCSNRNGIK
jgi:hypothetical protein